MNKVHDTLPKLHFETKWQNFSLQTGFCNRVKATGGFDFFGDKIYTPLFW